MIKNKDEQPSNETSLLDLPLNMLHRNILDLTAKPEAIKIIRALSCTSKKLHQFFQPKIDERITKQLLKYVLQGKENEVLKIAKSNPRIFFLKATANDYAKDLLDKQRSIQDWSPYQAMFGTGDKDMLASVKPYLDAYLTSLPDGANLAKQQEQEKFPNGFVYPPCKEEFMQWLDVFAKSVHCDSQLMRTGKASDATLNLLAQFNKNYEPGVVTTGYHFNINDFIKTQEIYEKYWERWYESQLVFFSLKIIALQERLLTAPYLQLVCMGIKNYMSGQPLQRDFESTAHDFTQKKALTIAPFTHKDIQVGKGIVIDGYYGVCGPRVTGRAPGVLPSETWKEYVKQTEQSLQDLCVNQKNITYNRK